MKYIRALLRSLVSVIQLLGLPLLGWGIDDLRGFLSMSPRAGYAVIAAVFVLSEVYPIIKGSIRNQTSKGEESKYLRRQHVLVILVLLFWGAILFLLPLADRRSIGVMMVSQEIRWLGLVLFGIGLATIARARGTLGRMYSLEVTIQKSHQLISNGLYRYIRHPIYSGVIIQALGFALVFRSWIGLAAMIPVVAFFLLRIKDEEAVLQKEFGPQWKAYCERSWRLIPYLY
jgi:protein-S-isoprenylcysteine O-methyltransferase Ste14